VLVSLRKYKEFEQFCRAGNRQSWGRLNLLCRLCDSHSNNLALINAQHFLLCLITTPSDKYWINIGIFELSTLISRYHFFARNGTYVDTKNAKSEEQPTFDVQDDGQSQVDMQDDQQHEGLTSKSEVEDGLLKIARNGVEPLSLDVFCTSDEDYERKTSKILALTDRWKMMDSLGTSQIRILVIANDKLPDLDPNIVFALSFLKLKEDLKHDRTNSVGILSR